MRHLFTAIIVGSLSVMSTAARAGDTGMYGSINVGASSLQKVDLTPYDVHGTFSTGAVAASQPGGIPAGSDTIGLSAGTKSSFGIQGSLGYDFGVVRVDAEIAYSRNRFKSLTVNTLNGTTLPTLSASQAAAICALSEVSGCTTSGNTISFGDGSKVRQLSALANLWFDIPIGAGVSPYVGGGLGISGFEIEGEGKGRFAWQLGAGVAVPIGKSVSVTADFRHREAKGSLLPDDAFSGVLVGKLKTNYFGAGLRFHF